MAGRALLLLAGLACMHAATARDLDGFLNITMPPGQEVPEYVDPSTYTLRKSGRHGRGSGWAKGGKREGERREDTMRDRIKKVREKKVRQRQLRERLFFLPISTHTHLSGR